MAISDTQKVDYLWKKVGYGAAKRDINSILNATQEGVPSPLFLRGENVWAQGNLIPGTIPGSSSGVVSVYTTGSPLEVSSFDTSARDYRSWNTGLTDWIPPELGSTYVVKVYVHTSGDAANASTSGTQLFGAGSGNNDEWFFDYQAGTLNFIGTNLPSGVNFSGKSIYISGARYTGIKGVAVPGAANTFTSLSITDLTDNILGNADTGAVQIDGGLGINKNVTIGAGLSIGSILNVAGVATFQSNIHLGDNDKINLGDNNDLQIYHDGGASWIWEQGPANLYIRSNGGSINLRLNSTDMVVVNENSSVDLYYGSSKKFETTGIGVSISNGASDTATITAPENLIIDPAAVGDNTGVVRIKGDLYVDGTTTQINSTTIELADFIVGIATTAATDLLADGAGINIGPDNTFLYEYNSGTNPSLKSSENLNVASGKVYQIDQTERLSANTLSLGTGTTIHSPAGNTLLFGINNTETFRIAADGQIGIGTTNPTQDLDIDGSVRIRDRIYDSNDNAGSVNYVLASGGPGSPWSWQSVTAVGATDSINIQDISDDQIQYILFSPTVGDVTGLAATTQGLVFNPSSRYIGIGLTTPTANLDVDGTATIRDDVNIGVGGTVALFDVSTGNIGLGTDNATTKLQVGSVYDPQVIGFGTVQALSYPATNVLIGDSQTGSSLTPQAGSLQGLNNNFIGAGAGKSTTTGFNNNFFGLLAGYSNTSGTDNNFFGSYAGFANTTGTSNNFLGSVAGFANTTGTSNNFLGSFSGYSNTSGSYNNFFGSFSGFSNTSGSYNNIFGSSSGNTTGSGNNFIGQYAGAYNTTGSDNNFFGTSAGKYNTIGRYNVFIGRYAGSYNTTGERNVAIGHFAGHYNTTGNYNLFLGSYTGGSNTYSNKIILGRGFSTTLLFDSPNTTSDTQLAIGIRSTSQSSKYWIVGDENFNIGIGSNAPTAKLDVGGDVNVSGIITTNQLSVSGISTDGVEFGNANYVIAADGSGTWGWKSIVDTGAGTLDAIVVLDEGALVSTSGTATQIDFKGNNISAIGEDGSGIATVTFSDTPTFTSLNVTGSTGLGTDNATTKLQVGSVYDPQVIGFGTADNGFGPSTNILIGDEHTGSSLTPQAIGDYSGINNTFIGAGAGKSTTTGYYNSFFGFQAGYYNTTGGYNNFFGPLAGYCNTSGSYNNFFGGYFTGKCNTTGSHNFFVGSAAGCNNTTGSYNIFFGQQAGKYNSTGSDNIAIGRFSGQNFINVCGNTHVGRNTGGLFNNCGSYNSFFGWEAGARNREGWFVNAFGYQAGCRNACGCYNNYFGSRSGNCNTNGCYNNFFGTYNGCSSTASYKVVIGSGKFNYLFDSPNTTKDYQLAIGIRTDTNPSKYWIVGDENFNIGIGSQAPTAKLDVGGDVNVTGLSTFGDNIDINGNVDISSALNVSGTTTTGQLNVTGVATFQNDIRINTDDKLRFGDSGSENLQIYTNGTNSFFKQLSGDLKYELADQFIVQKDTGDDPIAVFTADGSVELYYDNSKKFETTGYGVTVSGGLTVSGITTLNTDVEFVGPTVGITSAYWDSSENLLNFKDDVKATFGDSGDLQIYHTGSDSRIRDQGTGDLIIEGQNVNIINVQNGNTMIKGTAGGAADLYYDGDKKFGTTGIGVSIYNAGLSTATITGPSEIIIDPAVVGDNTGSVRIKGDLFVDGTQFTVDSGTIELADFVVGIATTVGNNSLLSGAGIGIGSESIQKTFLYEYNGGVSPSLKSSESLNVAAGKNYQIDQIEVLSATTLGSGVTNSSLTSVGTLNELTVSGVSTFQGNVYLGDLDVINIGDSNDLQIYHDGSTSGIIDNTVGNLIIRNTAPGNVDSSIFIRARSDENSIIANDDGSVELYYDNSKKFETTSNGIEVNQTTSIGSSTSSLSTLTQTAIHTELAVATYRSVEYTIQATQGTNFHTTKILALHNGTTAYHNEYGTVFNNSSVASFDVDISGGNIRLLASSASASQTDYVINFVATKV